MFSPFNPSAKRLTGLAILIFALPAQAATVTADSYSYLNEPSTSYPDSGGEMTDGITASAAWTVPSTAIGFDDVVNLVGWEFANPAIRFEFATVSTIRSVTVWAADSDGSAGADA